MKAAELFVRCLENEDVDYIFGIPGEENIDVMDILLDSSIRFITTRHEQGAAFMADVYGRLTGRAGVCLSTLGPGATNLVTGVADANMDRAPVVAIAGQAATTRMHKESHQHLDLVSLFAPISKYSTQIREPEIIPEVVRKAFKRAIAEKPGVSFIDFPENIAGADVEGEGTAQGAGGRYSGAPRRQGRTGCRDHLERQAPDHHGGERGHPLRSHRATTGVCREAPDSDSDHLHGQGSNTIFAPPEPGHGGPTGARLRRLRL